MEVRNGVGQPRMSSIQVKLEEAWIRFGEGKCSEALLSFVQRQAHFINPTFLTYHKASLG